MERTRIFLCGRKGGPVSSRRVKEVLGRYLPNCLVEGGEGWPPDRQGPGLLTVTFDHPESIFYQ